MRRILACILLAFTFAFGHEAEDVPVKTIEAIQRSAVPILCLRSTGKNEAVIKKAIGSGFLIDREGRFLTAAHVLVDLNSVVATCTFTKEECFGAIYLPTIAWNTRSKDAGIRWFKFTECQYSLAADLAACKLVNNPFIDASVSANIQPVAFGSFAQNVDGSPVAFTGFPLESIVPITSKGYVATYFPATEEFAIDKAAWPGASGSPVYDPQGAVIGIITKRGTNEGAGLAFARPVDIVLKFLRENKILAEK